MTTEIINNETGLSAMVRKNKTAFALGAVAAILCGTALAWTAPTTGDLGEELYTEIVENVIQGSIGFVAATALLAFGGFSLVQGGVARGGLSIAAAVVLFNSGTMAETLGYLV